MIRYASLRLLSAIPLLLACSLIVFSFVHLAPGNPIRALVGNHPVDPAVLRELTAHYHLNESFPAQYWHWLLDALHGNFGQSITFNASVVSVVGPRILRTVELAVYALVLIAIVGVGLGVLGALRHRTAVDAITSGFALVASTISSYVTAILLIVIFAVTLRWFPVFGLGGTGLDRIYHLTLPAIALALSLLAYVARTARASLIEVLGQEYIEAARGRGYTETRVVLAHALRNGLIPVVTIGGLVFGWLLSGSVLVEYAFGLNGLGGLLVQSVQNKDFAVVQAVTLIFAAGFIFTNILVDLLYGVIDPRVRLTDGRS